MGPLAYFAMSIKSMACGSKSPQMCLTLKSGDGFLTNWISTWFLASHKVLCGIHIVEEKMLKKYWKNKIFQSLVIYVIGFQFSFLCRQSPNRKITNIAWLWFQHSKYRYAFHTVYRKELKVVLYKSSQHCHVWQTGRKQYHKKQNKTNAS